MEVKSTDGLQVFRLFYFSCRSYFSGDSSKTKGSFCECPEGANKLLSKVCSVAQRAGKRASFTCPIVFHSA